MPGPAILSADLAKRKAQRAEMREDFATFAARSLRVRTKDARIVPLRLNAAQMRLHAAVEAMRAETGRVRVIVLKGRQQGCSTYIQARFFWRLTHRKACQAFILTHAADATNNLFGMAERFVEHCPADVLPEIGTANARELKFTALDSGYKVGTAGAKNVGRSSTIQLLHGSEVCMWPNAEDHAAGLLQTVPREGDTEVFLESTAKGIGNYFHKLWVKAQQGESDFRAVFIPWFASPEYAEPVADGFTLSDVVDEGDDVSEVEYARLYGLTLEQMAWRRLKIRELQSAWLFRQEYPATPDEAFQAANAGSFIPPRLVVAARKGDARGMEGPLILGVDPAREGGDRTAVVSREGRMLGRQVCDLLPVMDTMGTVAKLAEIIRARRPARVNIDVTGLGIGIYDRLIELRFGAPWGPVAAVNFASQASKPNRFPNKRSEMWFEMAEWFRSEGGVWMVDSDELQGSVCAPIWGPQACRTNTDGQFVLEPKASIKKRIGMSPDLGDAAALTFAAPVGPSDETLRAYPGLMGPGGGDERAVSDWDEYA